MRIVPIGKDIFSFGVITSVLRDVCLVFIKQTELRTPIIFNCQSWVARGDEKEEVNLNYLKKGRNLIISNLTEFINHDEFKKQRSYLERKKDSAKYDIVQAEIINNPASSTEEVYLAVKPLRLFKDVFDLQGLLDWMHKRGLIISNKDRYTWVGF